LDIKQGAKEGLSEMDVAYKNDTKVERRQLQIWIKHF